MRDRPVRRKDRQISEEEARGLLQRAEYGVLGLVTPEGLPYAVPLSFVYLNERIYFHCAQEGLKIDCIQARPEGAFTVVGETRPVYVADFSTYYESAMAFGKVAAVEDEGEKHDVLHALAAKYLPAYLDRAEDDIARSFKRTAVYALHPERITGKAKKMKPDGEPKGLA